ncbi:MAG: response regulator transcription factor [Elusimicrobia bacterium]|nr:response regulator transcription factor [Candidatus Liberimonas magnetica]
MNELIAVVDDEEDILELVSVNLKKNGYAVKGFSDSKGFYRFLKNKTPDLIVLDLMLPDMNGLELCKLLKNDNKYATVPVIMLTAKADESDKIVGLELGADDYVTKPFSPKELVARVKAVLRRFENKKSINKKNKLFEINTDKFEVHVDGVKIELTTTEFKLLEFLYSKRGKVYSREELMNNIWDEDKIIIDRTIDVHIKNLREKLGKAGGLIKNIRGIGYKMEE